MKLKLNDNWTTTNGNQPLTDSDVERYVSVVPTANQRRLQDKPFYLFFHFGMNTATGREWGNAQETVEDFTITNINPEQWVRVAKSSGATGIILTCKHHDGFCLWDTGATDFNVMNTGLGRDVVKEVSDQCRQQGMDFGVYLSPWDMHEPTYGTPHYNDFFCRQLTELLTNYGDIFEVWFDGAKGANAKEFEYDWNRYYKIIRTLQPGANIAICGPDIRWVGNEGGKSRKSEYSVVPTYLTKCETIQKNSQHTADGGAAMQRIDSKDEDLGSRKVLSGNAYLSWYPAEVDVSIRKGWFFNKKDNRNVKSARKLLKLYLTSVGNNCTLLLNVPPSDKGVIHHKDARALKKLGTAVADITANPVLVQNFGKLGDKDGYLEFRFNAPKKLRYCIIQEDIAHSQRVERFDLYLQKPNGKYKLAYRGTVIGSRKIIKLKGQCTGAILVIRQSRSIPIIKQIGFYE